MSKKQILTLFVCSLVPWTVGNGLLPLLPIYATQLGADPKTAGNYLAISYMAIALGAISAGWISDRFQKRKMPLIVASLAGVPITWLMGQASSILTLSVLTAILWFCGGIGLGLIGILTGLSASHDERGKIFGILSLTGGLGGLIGGLASGFIVDHWGFQTLFTVAALFNIGWPISGIFVSEKKTERVDKQDESVKRKSALGKSYYFLLTASLMAAISGFVIVLGKSLLMNDLAFSATEISITGAVSGIIAMPLPLLMGWLSDRTGRKVYLFLCYAMSIASLAILAVSTSLWHFLVVSALQAIFMGTNGTIGSALATDLLPQESLGRGLALLSATGWVGGVLGFAGAGYALQSFGMLPTFIISIGLPLIAIVLLIPCRSE